MMLLYVQNYYKNPIIHVTMGTIS